jgi:hypothetical protein
LALLPIVASAQKGESYEAEFVASDIFRSGSLLLPIAHHFGFEGDYFGGTTADTGYTAASWSWIRDGLKLSPGFGVVFGSNKFTTSPAFSFRWEYERKWFITQGLVVQSFRRTPVYAEETAVGNDQEAARQPSGFVRPVISDGNHVSARWRRVTIGGAWEHIGFREGSEWKGGGRLAIEILPQVSAVLYVLGPGQTEWRGGILVHVPKKK